MTAEKTAPDVWTEPPAKTNTPDNQDAADKPSLASLLSTKSGLEEYLSIAIEPSFTDGSPNGELIASEDIYSGLMDAFDVNDPDTSQYAMTLLQRYFVADATSSSPNKTVQLSDEVVTYADFMRFATTVACWTIAQNETIEYRRGGVPDLLDSGYGVKRHDKHKERALHAIEAASLIPGNTESQISRQYGQESENSLSGRQHAFYIELCKLRDLLLGLDPTSQELKQTEYRLAIGRASTELASMCDDLGHLPNLSENHIRVLFPGLNYPEIREQLSEPTGRKFGSRY